MIKNNAEKPRAGTRERVLEAAERLLGEGEAEFSMRELAAAASVSFATPFNLFGSKPGIMRALSAQLIERMHSCAAATLRESDTVERVLKTVTIAASVMAEQPAVNKAVMAGIGAPGSDVGDVAERSRALWSWALGDGRGLSPARRDVALAILPNQLAIAFRGVLSFWTAGEVLEEALQAQALTAATVILSAFVDDDRRDQLIDAIR